MEETCKDSLSQSNLLSIFASIHLLATDVGECGEYCVRLLRRDDADAFPAASSYTMAKVVVTNNAQVAASFLRDFVAMEVEKARWKLWSRWRQRIQKAVDEMCRELSI